MASPQLENGYLSIASGDDDNDIVQALVKAQLSGTEYQIILWVIRKTFGYKKKKDWISLSNFEKITGKHRTKICQNINKLVAKKLLVKTSTPGKNAYYSLNKDFDTWEKLVAKEPLVAKRVLTSSDLANKLVAKKLPTKDNTKEKTKERGRFTPPTLSEVTDYIKSNQYNVDPEQWINFYESKGWLVGKTKMKNWQAAVRTWAIRNGKQSIIPTDPEEAKTQFCEILERIYRKAPKTGINGEPIMLFWDDFAQWVNNPIDFSLNENQKKCFASEEAWKHLKKLSL